MSELLNDSPPVKTSQDLLNRNLFAKHIYELSLQQASTEQAVRIGLYGKWGEGKTAVLNFIEELAKKDQHICCTYAPWAANSLNDLWGDFTSKLIDILLDEEIIQLSKVAKIKKAGAKVLQTKTVKGLSDTIDGQALINTKPALSLLKNILNLSQEKLASIAESTGDRKIFIFIDDVDRVDPNLIPQLLISLRELFNIPNFIIIMAFDLEIVGSAISHYHPAWKGEAFVEKFFDFPYFLPELDQESAFQFFISHINNHCSDFIPEKDYLWIKDILPRSPRKIKLLVRSIYSRRFEIERHNPDELNFEIIFITQLIRIENHLLVENLEKEYLNKHATLLSLDDSEESDEKFVENLLKSAQKTDYLKALIHAWIDAAKKSRLGIEYNLNFFNNPHPLTWKEFYNSLEVWKSKGTQGLEKWLIDHQNNRGVLLKDLEDDFYNTVISHRENCLSKLADIEDLKKHKELCEEILPLSDLIEWMLLDEDNKPIFKNRLTPQTFKKVYDQSDSWRHFRTNPEDIALRQRELETLKQISKKAGSLLSPQEFSNEIISNSHLIDEHRLELKEEVIKVLTPPIIQEFIKLLSQNQLAFSKLQERDSYRGFEEIIFDKSSDLFENKENYEALVVALQEPVDYSAFRSKAKLLIEALLRKIKYNPDFKEKSPLNIKEFNSFLWKELTRYPCQYRAAYRIREIKEKLSEFIDEVELIVPDWLQAHWDDLERRGK